MMPENLTLLESTASSQPENFPAGLHVFVVDHDTAFMAILEQMLKMCNYQGTNIYKITNYTHSVMKFIFNFFYYIMNEFAATTCNGAEAALALLMALEFDIVLCDVHMPDMDGLELLQHIRRLEMDIPVISKSVNRCFILFSSSSCC
jgi:CheY-like chemotaxis protein